MSRLAKLVMVIAASVLSACGEWRPTKRVNAPDGRTVAIIEVRLAGASSSNHTRILLSNARGGTLIEPGVFVTAKGAIVDRVSVNWDGPDRLIVRLCDAFEYQVNAFARREPAILPDENPNGIQVYVENLHYSDRLQGCIAGEQYHKSGNT